MLIVDRPAAQEKRSATGEAISNITTVMLQRCGELIVQSAAHRNCAAKACTPKTAALQEAKWAMPKGREGGRTRGGACQVQAQQEDQVYGKTIVSPRRVGIKYIKACGREALIRRVGGEERGAVRRHNGGTSRHDGRGSCNTPWSGATGPRYIAWQRCRKSWAN